MLLWCVVPDSSYVAVAEGVHVNSVRFGTPVSVCSSECDVVPVIESVHGISCR